MKYSFLAVVAVIIYLASASDGWCGGRKPSLTNPLLKTMAFKEIVPFRDKIDSYLEQKKADGTITEAAFYFRSLADGIWSGIDEKRSFSGASLLKIPMMLAYYKIAETDPKILKKKIKYEIMMNETRNYVPVKSPEPGKYYTVDEMISIMIRLSDNNALIVLGSNLNEQYRSRVMDDLGLTNKDEPEQSGDNISIKQIVSLFRILYNSSYLNTKMSEKALKTMTDTDFRTGIVASLPPNIQVSHKFGERSYLNTDIKELHECAIVYYSKNPYLIGIMTRGKDFDQLTEVIKSVSKMVYDEIDYQYSYSYTGGVFEQ